MRRVVKYLVVFFILSIVLFYKSIDCTGYCTFINGDLSLPFDSNDYLAEFYPLWNDKLSLSNWITLGRLLVYYPIIFTLSTLNVSSFYTFLTLMIFFHFLSGATTFYSLRIFIKKIIGRENDDFTDFIAFLGGLLYQSLPYMIVVGHHLTLKLSFSLLPLFLTLFIVFLRHGKYLPGLVVAFLLISSTIHYFLYCILISAIILVLFLIFLKQPLKHLLGRYVLFFSVSIPLSAFWIIPSLLFYIYGDKGQSYTLDSGSLDMFSNNSNLLNVFYLSNGWNFTYFSIAFILLFVFLIFLVIKNIKNTTRIQFILLVLLLGSIFLNAAGDISGSFHEFITFNIPFGNIFRVPEKLIGFTAYFLIVTLTSYLCLYQYKYRFILKAGTLYILILFTTNGWIFSGNLNRELIPVQVPNDFVNLNSYLDSQKKISGFISIPKYLSRVPNWGKDPGGLFDDKIIQGNTFWSDGEWYRRYFLMTIFNGYWTQHSLLEIGEKINIAKYLDMLNYNYLIVHNDIKGIDTNYFEENITDPVLKIKSFGFINLYTLENINNKDYIHFANPIYVDGSIMEMNNIINSGLDLSKNALILGEFYFKNKSILSKLTSIYSNKNNGYLTQELLSSYGVNVFPFSNTFESKIEKDWSRIMISGYYPWYDITTKLGITGFQFDYLKGVIATKNESAVIKIPLSIKNSGDYNIFLRVLKSTAGGRIGVGIGENFFYIDTKSDDNDFLYVELGVKYLTKGNYTITITNIDGFNAINLVSIIDNGSYVSFTEDSVNGKKNKCNIIDTTNCPVNGINLSELTEYKKISSTKWIGEAILKEGGNNQGIIVFKEVYDPLWRMSVYKNEKLCASIEPIMINGITNGFLIPESCGSGFATIKIEYLPQKWFYISSLVSLFSLIFLIIVYYLKYYIGKKS